MNSISGLAVGKFVIPKMYHEQSSDVSLGQMNRLEFNNKKAKKKLDLIVYIKVVSIQLYKRWPHKEKIKEVGRMVGIGLLEDNNHKPIKLDICTIYCQLQTRSSA